MSNNYEDYFSEEAIVETLCRIRLSRAAAIHKRRFYRKIFCLPKENDYSEFNRLFPRRRDWHSFRPRRKARKNTNQVWLKTLMTCIKSGRQQQPPPAWAIELKSFVERLRNKVLADGSFSFSSPEIIPQPKAKQGEYRAIASFSQLEDKVVDILNAKYLREALEITLEPCSRAFRSGENRNLNRNQAIEDIYSLRGAHPNKPLFVTECDIRGFFDCVHHTVARASLKGAEKLLRVRNPEKTIDARAIDIFNTYLACYDFPRAVLSKEGELKRKTGDPSAHYKWPESAGDDQKPNTLKYFHKSPRRSRIGVPQGGAHSCLIANLILDSADKEVSLSLFGSKSDSLYLRYCDDIIVISTCEETCRKATNAYYAALKATKLPYHLATDLDGSLVQFFEDSKTKECYRWGARDPGRLQYPWIQFLGYQIRYDGRIRVRPSSIRKQAEKIEKLSDSLCQQIIKKKVKVSKRRILYRFNCKLWAFSSGRVQLGRAYSEPLPMCWASGFRQLAKRNFHRKHIRTLDQIAGRERRRLVREMKKQNLVKASKQTASSEAERKGQLRYFGRPFSHLWQFEKK